MARAEDLAAKGVNPADIDTRVDAILKYNWLKTGGIFTTTLKFDYKLSGNFGFNLEVPVYGHLRVPARTGFPGTTVDDTGVGDIFARVRYVTSSGAFSYGGAAEIVLPTASERSLGSGTYQLNFAALAVYAWSPSLITAIVGKAVQSVDELSGRARVQENSIRAIQAFILPQGRFVTLDLKYNWETINLRDKWWEAQIEFGMMLNAQTAASIGVSRKFGDRADRGAVTLAMKRFF